MTNRLSRIPRMLDRQLEQRPGLARALENTVWLSLDRVLRLALSLVTTVWLARYLGPAQYGALNYVIAFVGLFATVAGLGLNSIVVREISARPDNTGRILGSALGLQLLSGPLTLALAIVAIGVVRPEDDFTRISVAIVGASFLFRAVDPVAYWFESQVRSKYVVLLGNAVLVAFSFVQIASILLEASLIVFVWIILAQSAVTTVGLIVIYLKNPAGQRWRFDVGEALGLVKNSWPLALSGVAVTVYLKIDQVMLRELVGAEAVGVYSAAIRLSEVLYFIPAAILASVFPAMVKTMEESEVEFLQRLQQVYDLMVALALAIAIPMYLVSDWLVVLLFGASYEAAGSVLAIHVWGALFAFLAMASAKWYVVENLQIYLLYRAIFGACVNVLLNLVLIPVYGLTGAAIASLISYSLIAIVFDIFTQKGRGQLLIKLNSFNLLRLVK